MAEKTDDAAAKTNGFDPDLCQQLLSEWDEAQDALDEQHMESMRQRKGLYKVRDAVLDRAKKAGIPKKTFKHIIKERDLRDGLANIDKDLEREEIEQAELLRQALGMLADTPLGVAAQ